MSRCFPYPPPGYAKKELDASLIDSIKTHKEIEKAKKERRKEKRRGEKEKSKKSTGEKIKEKKHSDDRGQHKGISVGKNQNKICEKMKSNEQIEKSSITEEHEEAANKIVVITGTTGSYDSTDNTQNSRCKRKYDDSFDKKSQESSYKRKVDAPSVIVGHIDHEKECSGLRIRLPLLKHKDVGPSSTSRNEPKQQGGVAEPTLFEEVVPPLPSVVAKGHHYHHHQLSQQELRPPKDRLSKYERRAHKMEAKYRELIVKWRPPPLVQQMGDDEGQEEEWLSERKQPQQQETIVERSVAVAGGDISGGKSSSSSAGVGGGGVGPHPPRACYLPDANICALPYVLPF